MQIILDKKIKNKVKTISKRIGLNEKEFINRSIFAYVSDIENAVKLKKELNAWDILSAMSMSKNNF